MLLSPWQFPSLDLHVDGKLAIHQGLQMDVCTALRYEAEAYNRLTGTEDKVVGTLAWNEKRKPIFKGR